MMQVKPSIRAEKSIRFFYYIISFSIIVLLNNKVFADANVINDNWQNAIKIWNQYVKDSLPHIKSDTSITFIQIKNEFIDIVFPDYLVYGAVSGLRDNENQIFFIRRDGKVFNLGTWDWKGDHRTKNFWLLQNTTLDKLFQKSDIQIIDSSKAIVIAGIFNSIYAGPMNFNRLKRMTNNFSLFDERIYARFIEKKRRYRYQAKRIGDIWEVHKLDVRPRVGSKIIGPFYEIVMSKDKKVRAVRAKRIK